MSNRDVQLLSTHESRRVPEREPPGRIVLLSFSGYYGPTIREIYVLFY
jgi:hypothetical protein